MPFKGFKHSEETKRKIREWNIKHGFQKGNKWCFKKGNTFGFKKGNKGYWKGKKLSAKKSINKLCETCKKEFSYYPSTYKKRRFCSKKCDNIAKKTERLGMKFSVEHRENLRLAHIGKVGYWKDKKRSPEDIKKFRISHLGKKQSNETILKRIKKGKEHYNWQGGITPLTRKRTRGFFWKQTANKIRERDNNTCQLCKFEGNGKKLPVHHIIPFKVSKNNKPNNLITLCQSCHVKLEKDYNSQTNYNRDNWTEYFKNKVVVFH